MIKPHNVHLIELGNSVNEQLVVSHNKVCDEIVKLIKAIEVGTFVVGPDMRWHALEAQPMQFSKIWRAVNE